MKSIRRIACFILVLAVAFASAACGGTYTGPEINPDKIQIYAYAVDNGAGFTWLEKIAAKWNASEQAGDYEVIAIHGDKDVTSLENELVAKNSDINIYFGSEAYIVPMIERDLLIDISDVYDMKVDGDGDKISDKTDNFKVLSKSFSKLDGTGIYAVPYMMGISGFIFDYKFFLDNGWMDLAPVSAESEIEEQGGSVTVSGDKLIAASDFGNYSEGDVVLTKGKDGIYGTYDDGQFNTVSEFYSLLGRIIREEVAPFIYSTKYFSSYTFSVYTGAMAQAMGFENYVNFMALNGEIKGADGTVQANLTAETGDDAWETDVVKDAYTDSVQFFYDTIMGRIGTIDGRAVDRYSMLHDRLKSNDFTHKDAQNTFISGFQSNDLKDSAFLLDGAWWEGSEAKSYFDAIERFETEDDPRGYGEREYRYYLYPAFASQKDPGKSVLACQDDGVGFITDNVPASITDENERKEFLDKCKQFLAYTLSDENLVLYTLETGIPRAFDYELSESDMDKLTPFQRNTWEIAHDKENISIVYNTTLSNLSGVRSVGNLTNYKTSSGYITPGDAFSSDINTESVEGYLNGVYDYIKTGYGTCYDTYMRTKG